MLRVLKRVTAPWTAGVAALFGLTAAHGLAGDQPGQALTVEDISGVLKRAEVTAPALPPDDPAQHAAIREQAAKLMEQFNAPEHQTRIQNEQRRVLETVFKDISNPNSQAEQGTVSQEGPPDRERIYLFVSSSVPLATLRAYAACLDRAKARQVTMVLRGFVGGMKQAEPTLRFISAVLQKDPACEPVKAKCEMFQANIEIDPERFQRFVISEVPALAFVTVDAKGEEKGDPLIVSGDAGLDALLTRIDREAKSPGLQRLIAALSGNEKPEGNP